MRSERNIKCWKEHVWSSACLFTADFGSSLFVFRFFFNDFVNKMNALPVSNLHRATASRFWRGTARRRPVYYLGSGGGTDRRSGSKHENFLSTVYAFQRCSAFPDANTATDEDIPRRQAFCGPLALLAFAGSKYACWMKIRRYNSGTHMYCIYITVLLRGEDENRNQNSDYTFLVWHFVLTEMRVRRYLISVRSCYNVVNSTR